MIIQSLRAENILKYKQLDLQEIPQHGLIAISGQNESGKGTIGETICCALFGRTFSLDHNDIGKLIRWDEIRCDEPFAFFDQERTINSLAVLPELSEDLSQIFVTSQVFPDGAAFQREIACNRETTVLQ
ncbi:MAG: AAA family ATPase [Gammaproteobacteria bacterium]|nr:AAA family ATPase [Gammaproteobacteria bacterium]